MQNPHLKLIQKLRHPPAAANWVRFVGTCEHKTARHILRWVSGRPDFTYRAGYLGVKDVTELGISLETALAIACSSGNPVGFEQNKGLVRAHYGYAEARGYKPQNPIGFSSERFRVSRDLSVPVAPLSVIREGGKFVPIFLCGWKTIPLSVHQRRLLMTIYDDAFLSLTDFQHSPAEFLFFPENDEGIRTLEQWARGDYSLLKQHEVNEAVEIFVQGLRLAELELEKRAKEWRPEKREDAGDQLWLFDLLSKT